MAIVHRLLVGTTVAAFSGWGATASAQFANTPASTPAAEAFSHDIVVTGIRASLRSAQTIKRNSEQIVHSVVVKEIGKLPDVNVAEALQCISGVQIARDRGEGGSVAIRGLTQVTLTLERSDLLHARIETDPISRCGAAITTKTTSRFSPLSASRFDGPHPTPRLRPGGRFSFPEATLR